MFDALSERLQSALGDVRSRGRLTEEDVRGAMREVRLALLEADVELAVVNRFAARVSDRARGKEVLRSLNPGQHVVKIVSEELTALLGGEESELRIAPEGTTVVLMAGLQGSGKTTAAAKLARHLHEERGMAVALAACDTRRPGAAEQLGKLGVEAGVPVYAHGSETEPTTIAGWAIERARNEGRDALIVDTSGRLHVDAELMGELAAIGRRLRPHAVLLVLDSMTGQDAVRVGTAFAEGPGFDGVVLTKLDGDARGGAALSVKATTGRPILFASTGERLEAFERFHPDRVAQRILGMGDVMTLVEKAERQVDERGAEELERKLRADEFGLDDFLAQLEQLRRMGPLTSLLSMLPGVGTSQVAQIPLDEREVDRIQAIITSMTPAERARPEIIDGSRRRRIARGSGTSVQAVNQLVQQFAQMRKLMRQLASGKLPSLSQLAGGR